MMKRQEIVDHTVIKCQDNLNWKQQANLLIEHQLSYQMKIVQVYVTMEYTILQ